MPSSSVKVLFDDEGRLMDFLTREPLKDGPEERVRQRYLQILHYELHYPKAVLAREVTVYYGGQALTDENGEPRRADIVVYESRAGKQQRDQGAIRLIVEAKAPDVGSGHNQLVSYVFVTSANGAVWYNGIEIEYYRRLSVPENKLIPWPGIPGHGESWDAVGRQRKSELEVPSDIRGLLKRCHNRLHRRGARGDDITLDMVRILIAKTRDEERPGDTPEFYCTAAEYSSPEGRSLVADRVERLFEEFRDANPLVFEPYETIRVGADQVVEVVSELQHYRLVSEDEHQWDIMGAAYEEYTAGELKKEGGEFFTNRLVVGLLVKMLNPGPDDIVLDPAGGTGGFCTSALRHVRKGILDSKVPGAVKRRLIDQAQKRVFCIDIKHRLVKIAKTAMLLTGDGHEGCIQGDSLGPIEQLEPPFLRLCRPGLVARVLTNPPFAGLVNGRISDPEVLSQFELGKQWDWQAGVYAPTEKLSRLGTPPETLFLERCIEWLAPGGILGIVQPKGVLDTTEPHLATRHFVFRKCRVLAVITCHKNTFQPYTGSRTCLLVLQKRGDDTDFLSALDYPIFMAVSRKVGQDSEGEPVFRRDEDGRPTVELDEDLSDIYDSWLRFTRGELEPSEYVFVVMKSEIDPDTLNINPQRHLPRLNESLRLVLQVADRDEWSVTTVGQLAEKVYKGQRFKREDLETDVINAPEVRLYYTPAALLQTRGENVKLLDLSKASQKRKKALLKHVLRRGQIVITRSGTIGRVILVTKAHDGHIGSDDLIRVEISDEKLRYYVYGFLKTRFGQDQMKRNEYGTVQQHLEPRHVRELVVPIPDDPGIIEEVASKLRRTMEASEEIYDLENEALGMLQDLHAAPENAHSNTGGSATDS